MIRSSVRPDGRTHFVPRSFPSVVKQRPLASFPASGKCIYRKSNSSVGCRDWRHQEFFRRPKSSTRDSVKEVIQPQVPLRLPCYDFAPVTALAFGGLLLAVAAPTSGTHSFHGVTGGVYKARERIHRGIADPRLLAIPASCRRVADDNPN